MKTVNLHPAQILFIIATSVFFTWALGAAHRIDKHDALNIKELDALVLKAKGHQAQGDSLWTECQKEHKEIEYALY